MAITESSRALIRPGESAEAYVDEVLSRKRLKEFRRKERTLGEYESLLKDIGFAEVHGYRTTAPLDAVLAIK